MSYKEHLRSLSERDFIGHLKQNYSGYSLREMITHPDEKVQSVAFEISNRPGLYTSINRHVKLHFSTKKKMEGYSNEQLERWVLRFYSGQTHSFLCECDPVLAQTLRERKSTEGINLKDYLIHQGILIHGDMARPNSGRKPFRANRKRITYPVDTFPGGMAGTGLAWTRYGAILNR